MMNYPCKCGIAKPGKPCRYCGEAAVTTPKPTPTQDKGDSGAAAQLGQPTGEAEYHKQIVKRIVDRFAKYKRPGPDADAIAEEIMIKQPMLVGNNDPWQGDIPHIGTPVGENACRHLCDIIGWIFEIDAHNTRNFQWASVTHNMKNLRDHLLKPKSALEEQWMNFCCDWNGYKHGTRGSVSYALQTVNDAEFVEYGRQAMERIERYRAAHAAGTNTEE